MIIVFVIVFVCFHFSLQLIFISISISTNIHSPQLLTLLLDTPTDDSVETAVVLVKDVGLHLEDVTPKGMSAIFTRFRTILHEGDVSARVQFAVESVFKVRKGGFEGYPKIPPGLDLVEEEEQVTHEVDMDDDELDGEYELDVFGVKEKGEYDNCEERWGKIKREVLGESGSESGSEGGDENGDDETDDGSGSGSGSDDDNSDDDSDDDDSDDASSHKLGAANANSLVVIQDMSEQDLINLRRTIYLTIMSSAGFEECCHKLSKMQIPEGREMELINMLIECCSQERTFLRYYGLIAQRFCLMKKRWKDAFYER